ncbi:MAG: YfcE family phosphodiesterase [Methanobacteriota archaeon]|nr:MAG: YfcE family phosphodiesterase [Euryarchaeota archaeon]
MKVGVVSDSHKNTENLLKAVKTLIDMGVTHVIHLGDDYEDAEVLNKLGVEVTRVPGVFSAYYADPRVPNRIIKDYAGWRVLITHTPESHKNDLEGDIKPEEAVAKGEVDMVLHGHTHIPRAEKNLGVVWINPGHLKNEDKKGFPPTFAFIEFEGDRAKVSILNLANQERIISQVFNKK